jgi:hypothetical protein
MSTTNLWQITDTDGTVIVQNLPYAVVYGILQSLFSNYKPVGSGLQMSQMGGA